MPGLVRDESTEERCAEHIEVADGVEQLVADELVREAQALAVQHALLVEHDRVVEPAAERESTALQVFHLMHEAERAGACDLLQIRSLGEIDADRLRAALDHRMAEV